VDGLVVPRAAAEGAPDRLAHGLAVGPWMVAEERVERHEHPGDADPALGGAGLDEGRLEGVGRLRRAEPTDGQHLLPRGLDGEGQARVDRLPAEDHRARPTVPALAAGLDLGRGQALAQDGEQGLVGLDGGAHALAIERELERAHGPLYRARADAGAGAAPRPRATRLSTIARR